MSNDGRMTAEKIANAIELVSRKSMADEQAETVKRLNALTSLDWTVDADGLDVEEHESCANDTDHGRGTCYMVPDVDGLCPDCAIQYLTQTLVAGSYISVDVTR